MGTMLCYITTDAAVGLAELKKCVSGCVQNTFNRITIDGDTSTNDTVVVMANGAAGNRSIKSGGPQCQAFRQALEWVMLQMAKAIVGDGERVTKFVEVIVRGAPTHMDARKVAETVANSLLVKCSWYGGDANWGRIMHAIGYSRARIREDLIDIYFDGHIATKNGIATATPVELLRKAVAKREFTVTIDLNCGDADYNVFTSDLSQEYVDFNSTEYSAPVNP
jgi:glutamate N-acetyltransferase / amino-acid N-acetyltransferase